MPGNVRYASYSGGNKSAPSRAKSFDSLIDKNGEKANEYVPARITRTTPKANESAMQFVKTGPAKLYKSATEQIQKAEKVKEMRKHLIAEEEEWQQQPSSSSSSTKSPYDEDTDWQSNLDKWKSSRRKRNEEALERVIEIKKNEQEEEFGRNRRKSKTFSELREDKSKRGRRFNLVVHDDDNNDLGDLGLGTAKSTCSLNDVNEDNDVKDLDQDNKDAKSDAGFCTGSDTGSDGVFAEDNISDTSSALGDKKEAHDSLLDPGLSKDDEPRINGNGTTLTTDILQANTSIISSDEYTYDKAIEGYKQYAENSAKRRTSSITSLNSNTSYTKDDERKEEKQRTNNRSSSPNKSNKLEEKLSFFSKEMEKDFRTSPEPRIIMREKSPKVDIGKRRSMFEMNESVVVQSIKEQKQVNRRSLDMSNTLKNKVASFENLEIDAPRARSITPSRDSNLRSKVASFENLDTDSHRARSITPTRDSKLRSKVASFENLDVQSPKVRGITPPRDTKFHQKLATFASSETDSQPVTKKTPERDMNFHKKLASFTSIENGEEDKAIERKTIAARDPMLKNKIASFEQLEQAVEVPKPAEPVQKSREKSMSLECLDEPQAKEVNAQVFEIASKLEETPIVGSPTHMAPNLPLPVPPTQDLDSLEISTKPYTDDDINEVISDYEQVGGSYDSSSDPAENIYENITDEPMYENIYEKVNEDNHYENEPINEPHYQSLEEVREEVRAFAEEEQFKSPPEQFKSPPSSVPHTPAPQAPVQIPPPIEPVVPAAPAKSSVPAKPPVVDAPEVLDVTWTEGPSHAAPPSEPPPPPPPDDDSDGDTFDQLQNLPAQEEDAAFTRENSTRRIKKELWRRRSDFLGTSSQYIEEEPAVKPPPDLSEFLRKEREVDRVLMESKQSKISTNETVLNEEEIMRREREIIESLERSEQMQKEQKLANHTWENHSAQGDVQMEDTKEVDEHLQYQMAKNQQTSSESNTDTEVAMMVPEASPNTPESSHSVSETTDPEPKTLEFDQVENNPPTTCPPLITPTANNEDVHDGIHEMHVVQVQIDEEVTVEAVLEADSHSQVETECKLVTESSNSDYFVAQCGTLDNSSDSIASSSSLPDQYKKLAELEEEMMRHDKDMLQRAGKMSNNQTANGSQSEGHIPPPSLYAGQEEASNINVDNDGYSFQSQPTKNNLPIQEFYTAPSFGSTPPNTMSSEGMNQSPIGQTVVSSPSGSPSQYSTLASPHPFSRSQSHAIISGAPIHPPLHGVRSSPMTTQKDPIPEPLPRKKKLPPPPPSKPPSTSELPNTTERLEAIRLSRMPTSDVSSVGSSDPADISGDSSSPSGQQMSKQTLLALSAIPKPRLTDNESWIKKKTETRRDYSKHWLHQEAEQRRLEQQDRINRHMPVASQSPMPPSQTTPMSTSPQQSSPPQKSFPPSHNATTFIPQNTATPTYSSYPQSLKNPSLSQNNNNNNTNNSWRNQATTYQPPMPSAPTPTSDKALPDSIIHNLTQRVNNKNNKNVTYINNNGRMGNSFGNNNYRDENYHDYMNADALSSPSTHTPLYQSAVGPGQPSPPTTQQEPQNAQDQRLLSVSGKKKCSHCSDELGRGAAMIIESLRLFYHIPCFKCCVCGIQLGNGSAGADVRVRNHKLHCHNCYSNDEGMKFSKV